jgi:cyclase
MRIIDLSPPASPSGGESEPVVRQIRSLVEDARQFIEEMRSHFGDDFDLGLLLNGDLPAIDSPVPGTRPGTQVDRPSGYGPAGGHGKARNIDQVPLDCFFRPGVVLDLTGRPPGTVNAEILQQELDRIEYRLRPLDIVLLHTGASRCAGTARYFTDFVGLDASATHLLLDCGIRVVGTDAFSLDAPFGYMMERFRQTGDRSVLWPAYFAGRDREFCQIERLTNLDVLPARGFTVACFPVNVTDTGGGWARAVAIVDAAL